MLGWAGCSSRCSSSRSGPSPGRPRGSSSLRSWRRLWPADLDRLRRSAGRRLRLDRRGPRPVRQRQRAGRGLAPLSRLRPVRRQLDRRDGLERAHPRPADPSVPAADLPVRSARAASVLPIAASPSRAAHLRRRSDGQPRPLALPGLRLSGSSPRSSSPPADAGPLRPGDCSPVALVALVLQTIDPRVLESGVNVWVKPAKFFSSVGIFALTAPGSSAISGPERRNVALDAHDGRDAHRLPARSSCSGSAGRPPTASNSISTTTPSSTNRCIR